MNIEEYINQNRSSFETGEMPSGHKGRFLKKAEALNITTGKKNAFRMPFYRKTIIRYVAPVLCTAIATLLVFKGDSPAYHRMLALPEGAKSEIAIEKAYLRQLRRYGKRIMKDNELYSSKEELEEILKSITEDTDSFAGQLPKELSRGEKYRLLKEYYKEKFDALKVVRNALADNVEFPEE